MATLTLSYEQGNYSMPDIIAEVRKVHPRVVIHHYRFHPCDPVTLRFWLYSNLANLKERMTIVSKTGCRLVNYENSYNTKEPPDTVNYDDSYIFGLNEDETQEILLFISEEARKIGMEEYRENRRERREEKQQRHEEKIGERRAKRARMRQKLEEESSDDIPESDDDISDSSEEVTKG